MANQESHYQRVKNAFTPYLLVREDYDRNDKIAQAEIDLNEKLNQLGYIDGQDITGQFIRALRTPQSLDPGERWRPLSDRLNIDFTRLLSEFFNSPEYRQARRERRAAAAAADAEIARLQAQAAASRAAAEEAQAAASRAAAEEAQARLENARQRLAARAAARVESEAASQAHAAAQAAAPSIQLAPPPNPSRAAAAPCCSIQRARKNRKTRVRSRKMRKTRKISSR